MGSIMAYVRVASSPFVFKGYSGVAASCHSTIRVPVSFYGLILMIERRYLTEAGLECHGVD